MSDLVSKYAARPLGGHGATTASGVTGPVTGTPGVTGPVTRPGAPVETPKPDRLGPDSLVPVPVPLTGAADQTRLADAARSSLPPNLRSAADTTPLAAALAQLEAGNSLEGQRAAELVYGLQGADLTPADLVQLRRHILKRLPADRAGINRLPPATNGRPSVADIVQLLLPWSAEQGHALCEVASLDDAQANLDALIAKREEALETLEHQSAWTDRDPFFGVVKANAAEQLQTLEPLIRDQQAVVDGFEQWPRRRFGPEIERFGRQGQAVGPDEAGLLLYGLKRLNAKPAELGVLKAALLEQMNEAEWPPSARVEPPTVKSLFALMTGVDAETSVQALSEQVAQARTVGDAERAERLSAIRQSLVEGPARLLSAVVDRFHETGRGVEPLHAATLSRTLEQLDLHPEQLACLREKLLEKAPPLKPGVRPDDVAERLNAIDGPAALMQVFSGEVTGFPPLPLDRRRLTQLISKAQGARGAATLDRVRLLDGRSPAALTEPEQRTLAQLDRRIAGASQRLDELKQARAGVNAVRGERWLDKLEVDVLVGGAIGVPGIFSGSVMAGVTVNEADPDTGAREKGLAGYVMPAFSVGGYGKLDVSYTRTEGVGVSGGVGADFLGVWGGPGGRSWGNVFAGGLWIPQVVNVGAGYGVRDDEPYGALILSTFWPPFSTAAGRVDTVVRHPGLAWGAERGAELVRQLADSEVIKQPKAWISAIGDWIGHGLRPAMTALSDARFSLRANRAGDGLKDEDLATFVECLRILEGPDAGVRARAGDDPERALALYRGAVDRILPDLEALATKNPDHLQTAVLLAGAYGVIDAPERAVATATKAFDDANGTDRRGAARALVVKTALAFGDHGAAWPPLKEWLKDDGDALEPNLHLVEWLAAQGRTQEAKQLAEGLLHEHPRAFSVQNTLAQVTKRPAEAEVST